MKGERKTLLNGLCLPSNDLNCVVASSMFNEILLSSSLKLPSVSAAAFFSPLPCMWSAFTSNVHFTLHNFEKLGPIDFLCVEWEEEILCRVLYYHYTTVRPWQPLNPTNMFTCCVAYCEGQFYNSNIIMPNAGTLSLMRQTYLKTAR
jgi:hypothetical protein